MLIICTEIEEYLRTLSNGLILARTMQPAENGLGRRIFRLVESTRTSHLTPDGLNLYSLTIFPGHPDSQVWMSYSARTSSPWCSTMPPQLLRRIRTLWHQSQLISPSPSNVILSATRNCPICPAAQCPDCTCQCPKDHTSNLSYSALPTYESEESFARQEAMAHHLPLPSTPIKTAFGDYNLNSYDELAKRYQNTWSLVTQKMMIDWS